MSELWYIVLVTDRGLRVEQRGQNWVVAGDSAGGFGLLNEFLAHLADRNNTPRTLRAYAFDLQHFARWQLDEGLSDDEHRPILLAVSDNGPQMTSGSTREFMALCAIAQHFGRPGTPLLTG